MLKFKSIAMRNFMSIGAVEQSINLDRTDLTMILGENLDLGGGQFKNGTGKTIILQAISYALFNWPLNKSKMDNLINRTNEKNMQVVIEFSVDNIDYMIIRGRKPNILKFYVNSSEQKITDDAQGENKETQAVIEKIIGMSHVMFKSIVLLNTYNEPFLAMKSADQRIIIEQLLGITLLSEKADILREHIKETRELITSEEMTINANIEANKRIGEQITSLERRQSLWIKNHTNSIIELAQKLLDLEKIDIESELKNHTALESWIKQNDINAQYLNVKKQHTDYNKVTADKLVQLKTNLTTLSHVDIITELINHDKNIARDKVIEQNTHNTKLTNKLSKELTTIDNSLFKLEKEITLLLENKCYACGSILHDDNQTKLLDTKQNAVTELLTNGDTIKHEVESLKQVKVSDKCITYYPSKLEAQMHERSIELLNVEISKLEKQPNPYSSNLDQYQYMEIGTKPYTYYNTRDECIRHQSVLKSTKDSLFKRQNEIDPYHEQLDEMKTSAIVNIDYSVMNELTKKWEHQKFVLDLLTKPDSFIRKKIIDQNLPHLNSRLTYYLDRMNLPHQVVFKSDLTVDITELGRELDFYSLSKGEMNRVVLAQSFAFRDIWESIYHPINMIFVDELIDNGMDTAGVENALALMKEFGRDRHKSTWLVTHREELISRIPNVLKVIKEFGYTRYE